MPSAYHPAAKAFPWRDIRKDEAHAVLTNAITDQQWPGFDEAHSGGNGQIGALYRWKNLKDTPGLFQMELRMVTKEEVEAKQDLRWSSNKKDPIVHTCCQGSHRDSILAHRNWPDYQGF